MRAIKKITAFLLAMVMVLSLVTTAFAAEGDSPIVVSTADKTNVKPGEKLTITYTLAHDLDYMTALDIVLRYDATLFQFVSTDIDGSVWFDNPTQNGAYGADSQALVRIRQYNDDNEETIVAGKICSVTFASLDNISGAQTASFSTVRQEYRVQALRWMKKHFMSKMVRLTMARATRLR